MKVIDLLNRIAKGTDIPIRVKVFNDYYHYDIEDDMYYRDDEDKDEFYTDAMITGFVNLNDSVEIIEDNKIEKLDQTLNRLDINDDYYRYIMENRFKINEIIDKLNKDSDKND